MKWTFCTLAAFVSLALVGCGRDGTGRTTSTTSQTQTDRTTTTQSAPADSAQAANPPGRDANVNVDLDDHDRATVPGAGSVAGQDRVNLNTTPGGGVNVNIKGEPVRDLIRERREARREAETIPR